MASTSHEKRSATLGGPALLRRRGHYRTTDAPHGDHAGDLPPLLVNEAGRGSG